MKIGILSMQKICNYGSFLQALSLKREFESRGNEVYFIDIEKGRQIVEPAVSRRSIVSKLDKYFFKRIKNYFMIRQMNVVHISSQREFLHTDKKLQADERFDLAVIGSDEVFNATTPSGWGFSRQLFGEISNADRVVTYAASCGSTDLDGVRAYGIDGEIRECLDKVEEISVRDRNTYEFVHKLTGREPMINLDPVFLANYDEFIPQSKPKKPYMLIYAYPNRICAPEEIKVIKAYAKKHGLRIVSVGMQQRWCSHNYVANAFELLRYFKDAACVVTDTFHGTVFSIKYNKRFVALIRESNRNKLGGLLKQFGLYDRHVESVNDFESIMESDVNFTDVNKIIANEQESSARYFDRLCGIL